MVRYRQHEEETSDTVQAESPYIGGGAVDDAESSHDDQSCPRSGYHHDGPDTKRSNKEHVNGAVLSGKSCLVVLGESRIVQCRQAVVNKQENNPDQHESGADHPSS